MTETDETTIEGTDPEQPRRLRRSRDDRMIAAVTGGLARYFGLRLTSRHEVTRWATERRLV